MQMDICSHIGFPVNDVNSLHGFCTDTLGSNYENVNDFSVDDLSYGATKILDIHVDVAQVSVSIPLPKKNAIQMKIECMESHQSEIITAARKNDESFVTSEVIALDDSAKSVNPHCSSAPSLPERSKPVSAMKGSREKHGLSPPEQLTVKWAPDVYDPVPTSSLHIVINKPHKHGKKKSKSRQKNRSKSRGSRGKDKNQAGKDMNFQLCEDVTPVPEIQPPSGVDILPECSFVDSHGSSLHLSPVTEAI